MEQIKISGLSFSYPGANGTDLTDISLTVQKGDFILIFGKSGCGKSTLLRQLKPVIAPFGKREGKIEFRGKDILSLSDREQSTAIGFVSQNPDNQIVTDKVWHELAFGLENLGYDSQTIRLRVAEMASFFGIQDWFFKPVTKLSGGQRQILNLASVMVMQPEVLLLDEPTSQLDPIATSNFIQVLKKINDELGVTIVISEHHLEEVFPVCSRVIFLEKGRLALDAFPREIGSAMIRGSSDMYAALPACVKISAELSGKETPITVKEAKQWLEDHVRPSSSPARKELEHRIRAASVPAVTLEDIWFRYDKKSEDIVRGVTLEIQKGSLFSIVGGNGVGKSTLLSVIGGIRSPYRGRVRLFEKDWNRIERNQRYRGLIGYLPQEPRNLFSRSTVRRDLEEIALSTYRDRDTAKRKAEETADFFHLTSLLERHPFDLSGGEQQCAALAKVMLTEPEILLLDEPTKGIDTAYKATLSEFFSALKQEGKTIVMVSHDIDFCAECSDRCALMFNGEILSENNTREFFTGNNFYTTPSNRMARELFPDTLTCEDVIEACRKSQISV